ncbi:hypothetical protein [Aestuariirhabdus sp. LZHN29]|uniref:hypothetical protein n=1 Tax=Aestuariirhabdus sp. LZHN29 TaxID=3417462 RepID=UPI003CEA8A8A
MLVGLLTSQAYGASEQASPLCGLYSQRVAETFYSPTALWQRARQPLQAVRFVEDLEARGHQCGLSEVQRPLLCAELERLLGRHARFLESQWALSDIDGQQITLRQLIAHKRLYYCPGRFAGGDLAVVTRLAPADLEAIAPMSLSFPLQSVVSDSLAHAVLPVSERLNPRWRYLGGVGGLHPVYYQ